MGREPNSSEEMGLRASDALVMFERELFAEAEQFLLQQIRDAREDVERYFPHLHYGELLMNVGRLVDSRDALVQSAQIALIHRNDLWLALSHEKLGDLSAAEENWFGALHHYRYALRKADLLSLPAVKARRESKIQAAKDMLRSTFLVQDQIVIPLDQEYRSGNMAISFVHRDIFRKSYFARCLECNFCHDWCCSFGADIDVENVEKINQHREGILPFIRPSEADWFESEYTYYEEYSGNQYTRINPQGPRCVFISKDQRGCGLHRYALGQGMDYHEIKPLVCILFPLSFSEGMLSLAPELEDNSLVCAGEGTSVYRSMRGELEHYFGRELVDELDMIDGGIIGAKQGL